MEEARLMTVEEIAAKLRVSESAVRLWLREGELPGLKAGRSWRIRERDLDAYLRRASKEERKEV